MATCSTSASVSKRSLKRATRVLTQLDIERLIDMKTAIRLTERAFIALGYEAFRRAVHARRGRAVRLFDAP